jgi:hypothetical protein
MRWDEEDFYNEPSEFDIAIEEFKSNLMKSVKDEFVTEMDRLKKENAELQAVKKDFEGIKRDYENKKREVERERNDLQYKLRRERLVDLLKDHKIILYKAYSKSVRPPKCDKCDSNRRVEYISPLGRKTHENCLCSEGKTVYYPHEFMRYEFRLNRNKNGVIAWYRQYSDDEDGLAYDSSIHADEIYSLDMKFEDLKRYSTFFKTKEECQSYCDYLNSEEE